MQVSTIGVDLAKNVFQVHGVDSAGKVVITRQLRRKQVVDFFSKIPACLVGMEACGTAHHWAREVSKLGHTVRLMPPSYVKGYVKRSKNDAADAAAIRGCWPRSRPSSSPLPLPTKWRASPGRSWPGEDAIERRSSLRPPEGAWQWEREATVEQDNRIARVMMA